ncbi:MAG: TonB-dependent receptor [Bacteroides sp.]|nr:TonB-dependent receptor [Bacteroides sp.]
MKRNHYILAGILCTAFPLLAQAQTQPADSTLNRTVVVEQEYNPDIPDASKVNILPPVEEPTVSRKEVEYDATMNPSTALQLEPIGAYTVPEEPQRYTPGYVRAGYGSRGNLDLFANYLLRLSARDKLDLNFRMEGMNGKVTLPDIPTFTPVKWSSYYYRTRANAFYQHRFDPLDLNLKGNFGLSNFNFAPGSLSSKQKLTSGDIHVGIQSTDKDAMLNYQAETNLMLYSRQHDINNLDNKETIIRTQADVNGEISEDQYVGIRFAMNNLFYKYGDAQMDSDNYTTIDLNPYYRWDTDEWNLRIGVHTDFSLGAGTTFRISPDVEAGYTFSETYRIYVRATGGRLLNDFRRMEENTPYGQLWTTKTDDTYEIVNASLGLKGSPYAGTWFHVSGGYQNLKNDLFHIPTDVIGGAIGFFNTYSVTHTNNLHIGAEAGYAYKDLFSLSIAGKGYHWNADIETALYLKPLFRMEAETGFRPVQPLWFTARYEYIWHVKPDQGMYHYRVPAIHDIRLSATYNLYKGVSIYAHVNNLLNKKNQYYLNYPVQGINVLGGLSFRF